MVFLPYMSALDACTCVGVSVAVPVPNHIDHEGKLQYRRREAINGGFTGIKTDFLEIAGLISRAVFEGYRRKRPYK